MPSSNGELPPPPDRTPDLDDRFDGGLRPEWWVPAYLPHWTTPDRARARHRFVPDGIELRIDDDQLDWRPEDAPLRVSNLQTGVFSGPLGSERGTHRHRADDLVVRTETPQSLLFAPSSGRVEVTLSASPDPRCMTAVWLVGTEHRSAQESGEICIAEVDGVAIGGTTRVRSGIKAHDAPGLTTDMTEVVLPVDASQRHTWTVVWGDGATVIGCGDRIVRRLDQAPEHPLFLMVDLFEIGPGGGRYPKTATVHRVRAWAG
jgi:hypothetical protein